MKRRKRIKKDGKIVIPSKLKSKYKKFNQPTLETSCGINVRSEYERVCVEYFCENKIEFQYEPLMLLGGRQFRPDFYLPTYNLFIEICGYIHMPHYNDRVKIKKKLYTHAKLNAVFIECRNKSEVIDRLKAELSRFQKS